MNQTRLWAAAAIIALVIIVGFILSVPHTRDVPHLPVKKEITTPVPSVVLSDVFKKGIHTITGSLTAPNACATLTASTTLEDSGILIAFTVSADTKICLQVPTVVKISTTIMAPVHLPLRATVNGVMASTTTL